MEQKKLLMMSNGEDLRELDVKRGVFQGDSLSPLFFFFEHGTYVVDT